MLIFRKYLIFRCYYILVYIRTSTVFLTFGPGYARIESTMLNDDLVRFQRKGCWLTPLWIEWSIDRSNLTTGIFLASRLCALACWPTLEAGLGGRGEKRKRTKRCQQFLRNSAPLQAYKNQKKCSLRARLRSACPPDHPGLPDPVRRTKIDCNQLLIRSIENYPAFQWTPLNLDLSSDRAFRCCSC